PFSELYNDRKNIPFQRRSEKDLLSFRRAVRISVEYSFLPRHHSRSRFSLGAVMTAHVSPAKTHKPGRGRVYDSITDTIG
ncbi:hypothetical protein ABTE42_21665, partial [Acinetobacter baumannii]